jgi:hypothetical protein
MIGKPEWFTYRNFGWGVQPKTKEGWFYIIGIIGILFLLIQGLNFFQVPEVIVLWSVSIYCGLIVLDTFHILSQMKKTHDERENFHQLVIERNVFWTAISIIVVILIMKSIQLGKIKTMAFGVYVSDIDFFKETWELFVILGAMVITKGVSTFWVRKKM